MIVKCFQFILKKFFDNLVEIFVKPLYQSLEDRLDGIGRYGDSKIIDGLHEKKLKMMEDDKLIVQVIRIDQKNKELENLVNELRKVVDIQSKHYYEIVVAHADSLRNLNAQIKLLRKQKDLPTALPKQSVIIGDMEEIDFGTGN